MKTPPTVLCLAVAILIAHPIFSPAAGGAETRAAPDFTKGATLAKDAPHDWTLGPTGARGWIFTANGHSRDARQILVTAVAKDSPSASALNVGDVILGVDGMNFSGDARVQFANAVTTAETEKGGGKLRLLRWRGGKSEAVDLKLPVLGSYSATAPYDCAKSKRIFELGSASLAKRMAVETTYTKGLNPIPRALNGLAILASGNKEWLPLVKREAQWAADFTTGGYLSWYYGYNMALAAEYVMATGDQSVMPGLTRLALETARGQSAAGTWGHRFAEGGGNLGGYGAMNAPGIPLTIGMVLAREAGVKDADLDRAITKSAIFLRWYVNKGAVPYGDHLPFPAHEDNGKCAAAAVLFDLLGDREAAEFFSKMATAGYSERERGHTGNYFNVLWAMQGVARCGPLTTGAYQREQSWYYDLARQWDTSWRYQGSPVGEEEHGKYTGWDMSGSHLLDYALPLKSLRLTGKKPFTVPPLNAAQTAEVIAAGRDYAYRGDEDRYEKRTTEQLLAGLSSWSPFVRKRSGAALGKRDGDHLPALLKLLVSPNRESRYGAAEALGYLGTGADSAAPQLRAALKDPDPWVQALAAESIPALGPEARKASVGDLLALVVRTSPADPRRLTARSASVALFANYPGKRGPRSILADSLEGVDRAQLYPAIRALLQHDDSVPRAAASKAYERFTDADLVALLPDIFKAIQPLAPSNEMFADGVRLAGLDLLSRLQVREGMALCVSVIEPARWGSGRRIDPCVKYLQRYGTHAKSVLPQLREVRAQFASAAGGRAKSEQAEQLDKAIAAIESSAAAPTLISIADFKVRPAK